MIIFTTSTDESELAGIITLQKANLKNSLSAEEIEAQGFVTVVHTLEDLKKLNNIEQHVIAKEDDRVVAYLLAMTARSRNDIPILIPMFEVFDAISFRGKVISACRYIVVGQVCVAKDYRGKGVLDAAYARYREQYQNQYDFAITEIAGTNLRSLNAHKRIGFAEVHRYRSPDDTEWIVVLWDWVNAGSARISTHRQIGT